MKLIRSFTITDVWNYVEWGYVACEKGWNLEKTRQELNKLMGGK